MYIYIYICIPYRLYSQTYINFSNVLRAHDVIIIMKFNLLYLLLQESEQGVLEQFTCVFATEYDILIDTNKIFLKAKLSCTLV